MNEKKFTEVFNKYNRLVRKMVISRSGNDMLAEEICQQVFLQYFEQMNNISEELIQPWLLLTTRNMVYDYLRKMQVRKDTHSINGNTRDNTVFITLSTAFNLIDFSFMFPAPYFSDSLCLPVTRKYNSQ